MAETYFDEERTCQCNRFQRAFEFWSHRQQHGVGVGDFPQLADVVRSRVEHQRRIMRAVEARFSRKKRPFDMPAGDGMAQFLMPGAQLAELLQPLDQLRPYVGYQRQEKATTGCRA